MIRNVTRTVVLWFASMVAAGTGASASGSEESTGVTSMLAAFHVLSRVSTGRATIEEIATRAERLGLDAVILSDDFSHRYEYGLWPLRGVVKRVVTFPSVLSHGVDRMMAEVAAAQARHPRVLLVPGVLVAPHYYWTGSLFSGDLTLRNSEQNLIVVGLPRRADYEALPVTGNPATYRFRPDAWLNVTPALLFIPAAWLWRRRITRTAQVGLLTYSATKRRRAPAVVLAALATGLLLYGWPFGRPVYSIYDAGLGYRPAQTLIETVTANGGITVWSLPETKYDGRYSYGLFGTVAFRTDPHPEALMLTRGYTGFGGVYQDNHSATRPGEVWDQTLLLHLDGQRSSFPVAFGEVAFDGTDKTDLNEVLTVLLVRERTEKGILEAMKAGRQYAVNQHGRTWGLRLPTFGVACHGGQATAISGDTFHPTGGCPVDVRVSVVATDGRAHPIVVTVIRSGGIMVSRSTVTPFEELFQDEHPLPEQPRYYRVQVQGEGELLSNPIFVKSAR